MGFRQPKGIRDYRNIPPVQPAEGSGLEVSYGEPPLEKLIGLYHLSGITGDRPTSPRVGCMYFDTTLGIPIWYDGTNWINATGATV